MKLNRIVLAVLICVAVLVSGIVVYAVGSEDEFIRWATPDGAPGLFDDFYMPYIEKQFFGVVVIENGYIAYGQSVWDAFLDAVDSGVPSTVELENHFTFDPSRISPELCPEIINSYPTDFRQGLCFDGDTFMLSEGGDSSVNFFGFKYLKRFEDSSDSSGRVTYVLFSDFEVSWEQVFNGLPSSIIDYHNDHMIVLSRYS